MIRNQDTRGDTWRGGQGQDEWWQAASSGAKLERCWRRDDDGRRVDVLGFIS